LVSVASYNHCSLTENLACGWNKRPKICPLVTEIWV
jgi:hypothetical protein